MINIVFSKMEAYSGNFGIQLSKLQERNSFVYPKTGTSSVEDEGSMSVKNSDKSLKFKKATSFKQAVEEEKSTLNDSKSEQTTPHGT